MNGIRIWLDMSSLLSGVHQQSCVYVNHDKYQTVRDVEDHIRRLFAIDSPFHILNDGYLLPPSESSFLLRDNDTLSIILKDHKQISTVTELKNNSNSQQTEDEAPRSTKKVTIPDAFASIQKIKSVQSCSTVKTSLPANIASSPYAGKTAGVQESVPFVKEGAPSMEQSLKEPISHPQSPFKKESSLQQISDGQCVIQTPGDNEVDTNSETESGRKRKRIRRRKKKSSQDVDSEPKPKEPRQSPYILNKYMQGVSHILNSSLSLPTNNKKHIFFQDEHDKPDAKLESFENFSKVNGNSVPTVTSIGGDLTKLMSLGNQKGPAVFERRRIDQENVCKPETLKPVVAESPAPAPVPASSGVNGNSVPTVTSIGGDLTKLMSLGNQKGPAVFERRRIDQENVCKPETLKPVVAESPAPAPVPASSAAPKLVNLNSMPVKETTIKFKILKMINYSPVISEQITARVISPDFTSNQLFVQILDGLSEMQTERGKFSLDQDEGEEIGSSPSEYMYLNFADLIEPKSVIL